MSSGRLVAVFSHPSLEHWDGTSWGLFPVPNPYSAALGGLLIISSNNIWVAERTTVNGQYVERMEYWNGKGWHAVSQ
ncbi:hypothetical protein [Ktedonobacter robiniae]|uniref:Uncharacterized protein n=1 Tax=Ktedonobacter robiniae TaxID=2778365 RepID=A0ABQ3V063_9CHLR|nr:hypothetical protein [Ktedonobacter robiniae]GHO58366.1 hypothetical protein KSB_68410 [Ktedonobacter robiniae]